MAIDRERLLNYRIPPRVQSWTKREAAFYALSVGMGHDPLDRRQLRFVDQDKVAAVLPSMIAVLGHPGFWLADPATGVDPTKVVHAEQTIDIHEPCPVEGDIIARTRITGLVDKGPGRAALLYSVKEVAHRGTGRLIATTGHTTFIRGAGGFGGQAAARDARPPMPDAPPDIAVELATRPEQALYYRQNGDDNPLHVDPDVALRAGFQRPILHGLATLGVVCHALVRELCGYEPTLLKRMSLRFAAPVYPGETIRVEMWRHGAFRAWVKERDVVVIDDGRATVTNSENPVKGPLTT